MRVAFCARRGGLASGVAHSKLPGRAGAGGPAPIRSRQIDLGGTLRNILGRTCSTPLKTLWRPAWLREHPQAWAPGTLDRDALHAASRALAANEGFEQRASHFARNWLRVQAEHPGLRSVFRNTPRYLLLIASAVMHHRRDPADPLSGVTPSRLAQFFAHAVRAHLHVSASQLKAALAHARLHGLLQPAAGRTQVTDARFRPLEPTALLDGILRQWIAGFLRACEGDEALPLPAPVDAMIATPGLVGEMFGYRLAALEHDRFILWEDFAQPLAWVLRHDHGYRVFLQMTEAMQALPDGTALVPITAQEISRRAAVSRGTVRNLLADAQAHGWFVEPAPAGARRLAPKTLQVTLQWTALELVWMHGLACAAWARMQAAPHTAAQR